MITITYKLLEEMKTPDGDYTRATMDALGMEYGTKGKWRRYMIGKTISESTYAAAIAGKFIKKTKPKNGKRIMVPFDWLCDCCKKRISNSQ